MSAAKLLRLVRDADRAQSQDPALRPVSFDDFVGQAEVIDRLRVSVRAAKRGGWQLDHALLTGGAGCGKTTLAAVIANELGATLRAISAPAIEHKGVLASLLTTLEQCDVLFIDEIHALDRALVETIYSALEDRMIDLPAGKRVIRVPLPHFTLIGATTHTGKLAKPLIDRFGITCELRPYTLDEITTIVARSAQKIGIALDEEGALVIARASRGTPRIANRLLRRVRDFVTGMDAPMAHVPRSLVVGAALANAALEHLGIDELGLGPLDRRYLAVLGDRPLGVESICVALGEERCTIEGHVEPHLLASGLIERTARGRGLASKGMAYRQGGTSTRRGG